MIKIRLFRKPQTLPDIASTSSKRLCLNNMSDFFYNFQECESTFYDQLRLKVPVIDACINKIIRLTGNYKVICSDDHYQNELNSFVENIPVGISGNSLFSFTDVFLDSLLTYGNAVGEILLCPETKNISGLYNADSTKINVRPGNDFLSREYYIGYGKNATKITHPEKILYSCLNPTAKYPFGCSILRGLPAISSVLMRIYECIGQNFDRIGNVRYAVTYKPSIDSGDKTFAKERALQIAKEWSDGMNASRDGQIRDFVAVGDIDIKVIGAENQIIDTEIPVRQLLEEIVAKLGIPPFLLGLNWSTTERMSKQQCDILTSELEFYRRLLNPVIRKITTTFLRLCGSDADVDIEWENINLQDETELANARLLNAQALKIEQEIKETKEGY